MNSVHGRHFVLMEDGRLQTSDKIMGQGRGDHIATIQEAGAYSRVSRRVRQGAQATMTSTMTRPRTGTLPLAGPAKFAGAGCARF